MNGTDTYRADVDKALADQSVETADLSEEFSDPRNLPSAIPPQLPFPSTADPTIALNGSPSLIASEKVLSDYELPDAEETLTRGEHVVVKADDARHTSASEEDGKILDSPIKTFRRKKSLKGSSKNKGSSEGSMKAVDAETDLTDEHYAKWPGFKDYVKSLPESGCRGFLMTSESVKSVLWTPTRIWLVSLCSILQGRDMWNSSLSMQLLGLLCAFIGEVVVGGARYNVVTLLVLMASMRFKDFPDKTMRPQLMITTLTCITLLLDASIILSSGTVRSAAAKATAAFTAIAKVATLYDFLLVAKNAPKARKYFIRRIRVFFIPLHRPRNPMRELRARILAIEWIEFIAAIMFFILFLIGVTSFAHLSFVSEPSAGVGMIAFLPIKVLTTGIVAYALLTDTDTVLCLTHFGCMNSFMGYVKRYVRKKYEELDGWPLSYGLNPYRFYAILALKCIDVVWGFVGLAALFSSSYLGGGGGIPDPNIKTYVDLCFASVFISDFYVSILFGIVYWLIQENRRRLEIVLHTKSNGEYEATYEDENGSDDSELDDLGFRVAKNRGQSQIKTEQIMKESKDGYLDVELNAAAGQTQLRDPEAFIDARTKNIHFSSQFASPTRVDKSRRLQFLEPHLLEETQTHANRSRVMNSSRYSSLRPFQDDSAHRAAQGYVDDGYVYEDHGASESDDIVPLSPADSSSKQRFRDPPVSYNRDDERPHMHYRSGQHLNRSQLVDSADISPPLRQVSDDSYGGVSVDRHVSSDSAHGLVDDELAESPSLPFEFSAAMEEQLVAENSHFDGATPSRSSPGRRSPSGKRHGVPEIPDRATVDAAIIASPFAKGRKQATDAINSPVSTRRLRSLQSKPLSEGGNGDNQRNTPAATATQRTNFLIEKREAINLMSQYLVSADQFSAMWESLPMSSSDTLTFSAASNMTYETMKSIASKHFHAQGFKIMASGVTGAGVTLYIYGASVQARPDTEDNDIVVFLGEIQISKGGIDDVWELHYVCKCTDSAQSISFFRLLNFDVLLSSPGLDDL